MKRTTAVIIGNAIVWAAVILAAAWTLRGTECFGEIQIILGGGAAASIIVVGGGARHVGGNQKGD